MRYLLLITFLLPSVSHAAITINEVAWMGSDESASYEWIELYNDGVSAVDVSGWTLTDNMNLSIALAGSIAAGEYAVLERSSDAAAPGTAFLVYTGALVNSGATLALRRADNSLEDQVAGGDAWENIGGDNTTKETAQYTTSGWITADPTPGSNNSAASTVVTNDRETDFNDQTGQDNESIKVTTAAPPAAAQARSSSGGGSKQLQMTLPEITLDIDIDAPAVAYVNQPVSFAAEAGGIGDTLINSLTYDWNFGDTYTASVEETSHRFQYPGTYVVTVHGHYKRQEYVGRHEITVLPVNVSLTRNTNGDLQINNAAPYEIDLSDYQVVGSKTLLFPDNTILLPNQTITIASHRVGGPVTFHDELGAVLAAENGEHTLAVASPVSGMSRRASAPASGQAPTTLPSLIQTAEAQELTQATSNPKEPQIITIPTAEAAADAASAPAPNPRWPYGLLAVLLGILSLGLLLRKS